MQLNTVNLESGMVRVTKSILGNLLSKDANGRVNVIKAHPTDNTNDKGFKPDLPFATVQVIKATNPFGWLLGSGVDDDDNPYYTFAFQVQVMIEVYGKGSHDIITELKQRLSIPSNRDLIETETGSRLYDSGDLPNNYSRLATDDEQYSPLIISLVLNSVITDTSGGGIIEKIIMDGGLYYSDLETIPDYKLHIEAP